MAVSTLNRFLLLGLLPIIALVLYLEGQSYDPALIRFTAADISTGAEAAFFPREIEGYSRAGQVRLFTKENLYEYVNGHAEYFLSAGFVRLAVGEYVRIGTEPGQPDIVVDMYDMGKGIHAFGVLSDEVGENAASLRIGTQGAKTSQGVSFVSGRYYVKITAFQDAAPAEVFARRINELIGAVPEDVTELSRLPDLGEVTATRFVKEAYRGLGFVQNVIEREYRIDGNTVQVSLVTGGEVEIQNLASAYRAFFDESGTPYTEIRNRDVSAYKIMDPYEGNWYLVVTSDALFGIYGEVHEEIVQQFLSLLKPPATGKGR